MTAHSQFDREDRAAGFTLIEVVGAFFMMVVILVFITGIFVENGRQRRAATELMSERNSASGVVQLIRQDIEGGVFLSPREGEDPGAHPWQFLADSTGDLGARAIRFVTQNAPASNHAEHASNWIEVAYFIEENRDGESVLWRWNSTRPPSEIRHDAPDSGDLGSVRIAVGVSDFGIRLLDSEGTWNDDWDSTYRTPAQAIPEAAEISLALFRQARPGEAEGNEDVVPGLLHVQRVALAMKPMNVAALISLEQSGGENGLDCFTIAQCQEAGDTAWSADELADDCGGDDELCDLLQNPSSSCWSVIESRYPQIAALAPTSCQ